VGLLDRAENLAQASSKKISDEGDFLPQQKPSLLEKAQKFLSEEPVDDWIGDADEDPASAISDDLPLPDGQEEIDIQDLGGYEPPVDKESDIDNASDDDLIEESTEDDSAFGDLSENFDEDESTLDDPNEDDAIEDQIASNDPIEDEDVSDDLLEDDIDDDSTFDDLAQDDTEDDNDFDEKIDDEEDELEEEEQIEKPDDDLVSVQLPDEDVFDEWEKDAHTESTKQPVRPPEEDPLPHDQSFLFDDDSDFSTAPMGHFIASKKRMENYQAVFEITKEIAASKDFSEFFDNLVFSIMGQVGCSNVVVITSTSENNERWDALSAEGIELNDGWVFHSGDEVYQRLNATDTVIYSGELKQRHIPEREIKILEEMESELLVPLRYKNHCFGILSLGQLINGEEYIVDDIEFVKVIGDIAGSVFSRVSEFEKLSEELVNVKQVIEINESIIKSARDFASVRKMDDAYDLLIDNLKKKLGVKQFSFLVLDSETKTDYIVFGSNFILPERAKDFRLDKDSDIVGMVSNVPGVYKLENFREDSELKSIFTNDELGIMSEFTILPIINLNWLVGMVIIHSTTNPWTDMSRDVAVAIMETSAPVLANLLILSEKEALFRNPFNPLETKILNEIEKAEKLQLSFTVSIFKIQNVARMVHLFGAGKFARYADTLRKTITDHISENDFFTRVGQGKFAIVLHGKDREETEIVIKKIKASFSKKEEHFSASFKPSYRILSLSFPKDTKDKNQFMEMIEEA